MAFVRVPGTARRYFDTDAGEEISRREYQRRIDAPLPKVTSTQRREARAVTQAIQREDRAGRQLSRAQIRRRIKADLASGDEQRIRRALVDLGRREPDWKFNVGETPT